MIGAASVAILVSLPMFLLKEPVRGKQDGQEGKQFNWSDVREVLSSANYVALLLLEVLNQVAQQFLSTWLIVFLTDDAGLSGGEFVIYSAVPAIIPVVIFTYPIGVVTDRVQRKRPVNGRLLVILGGQVRDQTCCGYCGSYLPLPSDRHPLRRCWLAIDGTIPNMAGVLCSCDDLHCWWHRSWLYIHLAAPSSRHSSTPSSHWIWNYQLRKNCLSWPRQHSCWNILD